MVRGRKAFWPMTMACAAAFLLPSAGWADTCSTPTKFRECSQECCGRTTCSPACQGDCVRRCVEACRNPAARPGYQQQLSEMQTRCGYRQGPARMLAPR